MNLWLIILHYLLLSDHLGLFSGQRVHGRSCQKSFSSVGSVAGDFGLGLDVESAFVQLVTSSSRV